MVIDAVLWFILAAAMGFIAYGCWFTRPAPKAVEESFVSALDRAA